MPEKRTRVVTPAIHPSCATPHASERTPEPMIAVIICALAVQTFPISTTQMYVISAAVYDAYINMILDVIICAQICKFKCYVIMHMQT